MADTVLPERSCLRCSKPFTPETKTFFLCPRCRKINANISGGPKTVGRTVGRGSPIAGKLDG